MTKGSPKSYEIQVVYTEDMVRLAGRRYLVRFARRDTLIALIVVLFAVSLWLTFELDWKQPVGLCALALCLFALVFFVGRRYVRLSLAKFRALKDPTVVWWFSEETIAAQSEIGKMEVRWDVITHIWRFPEAWLLFAGNSGYSTLPTSVLTPELQDFIVSRVKAHGGKIV